MGSSNSTPLGSTADSRPSARFNSGIPYLDVNFETQVTLQRTFSHNCINLMATSEYGFAGDILPTKSPDFLPVRLYNSYVKCLYSNYSPFTMTVCFDDTSARVVSEAFPYGHSSSLKYVTYGTHGYRMYLREGEDVLTSQLTDIAKKYIAGTANNDDFVNKNTILHCLQKYYTGVGGTTLTKDNGTGYFQAMKIMNSYFSGDFFPNVKVSKLASMDDAPDVFFHLNTTTDTVDHQHDFGPLMPAVNNILLRNTTWQPKSIFKKDMFGNRIIENGEYALSGRPFHYTVYRFPLVNGDTYVVNFNLCRNYLIGLATLPTPTTSNKVSGVTTTANLDLDAIAEINREIPTKTRDDDTDLWDARKEYETAFYNTGTMKSNNGDTDDSFNLKYLARYNYQISTINTGNTDQSLMLPLLWINNYKNVTEDKDYGQKIPYNYADPSLLLFDYRSNLFIYTNRHYHTKMEMGINNLLSGFEDGEKITNNVWWCTYSKDQNSRGDSFWWAGPSSRYLQFIMSSDNRNYSYSETNTRGEFACSYHEVIKYTNPGCITKVTPTQLAVDTVDADFWARYIHRHGLYWTNRMVAEGNTNYQRGEELSAVELFYSSLEEAEPTDATEIAEDFPIGQKFCIGYNMYGIPNESIQITNSREKISMDILREFATKLNPGETYTIGKSRDQMTKEMRNFMTFYKPSSIMFSKGVTTSVGRPNMARYTYHGMFDSRIPWDFDDKNRLALRTRSTFIDPFGTYPGTGYNNPRRFSDTSLVPKYIAPIRECLVNINREFWLTFPNTGPFKIYNLATSHAKLDFNQRFKTSGGDNTTLAYAPYRILNQSSYTADMSPDLAVIPWKTKYYARAYASYEMGYSKANDTYNREAEAVASWSGTYDISLYQSIFYCNENGRNFIVPYMYNYFCNPESDISPLRSFPTWYSEAMNVSGGSVNLNGIVNQPVPFLGSRILDYANVQLDPTEYQNSVKVALGLRYEPELIQRRYFPSHMVFPGAFKVPYVSYSETKPEYNSKTYTVNNSAMGKSVSFTASYGKYLNTHKKNTLCWSRRGFYRSDGAIVPAGGFFVDDGTTITNTYPYEVQLELRQNKYSRVSNLDGVSNFTTKGADYVTGSSTLADDFEITVDSMNVYCVNKIIAKDYTVVANDVLLTLEKPIVGVYLELSNTTVKEKYYSTNTIFASKLVNMYQVGRRQELFPGTASQIFTSEGEIRVSGTPLPIWYDSAEFWWKHEVRSTAQPHPWRFGVVDKSDPVSMILHGSGKPLLRVRGLYEDPRVAIMYDAPSPNLIHFDDQFKIPSQKLSREQVGTACSYYHPYTSPETFVNFGYNSMFSEKFITNYTNRIVFNAGTNKAMLNTIRAMVVTGNYLMFESFLSLNKARFVESCVGSRIGDTTQYDMMFAVHQVAMDVVRDTKITMPTDTSYKAFFCPGVHYLLRTGISYYSNPDNVSVPVMADDLSLTIMFVFAEALMACTVEQIPGLMKIWQKYCIVTGVPVVQITGILSMLSCLTYLDSGKQKSIHAKICHGMNISRMDVSFENNQVKANVATDADALLGYGYTQTENGIEETTGPFESLSASPVAVMERCAISVAIDTYRGVLGPARGSLFTSIANIYQGSTAIPNYDNNPYFYLTRVYMPDIEFGTTADVNQTDWTNYSKSIYAKYIDLDVRATTAEPAIAKLRGETNLDPYAKPELSPINLIPFVNDVYNSYDFIPMFALYRSTGGTISSTLGSTSGVKYAYSLRMSWESYSPFLTVGGKVCNPYLFAIPDTGFANLTYNTDKGTVTQMMPLSSMPTEITATATLSGNYSVAGHGLPIMRTAIAGFGSQFTSLWSYDEIRLLMGFFAIYLENNNTTLYNGTSPFSDFFTFASSQNGSTWMAMKTHDHISSKFYN